MRYEHSKNHWIPQTRVDGASGGHHVLFHPVARAARLLGAGGGGCLLIFAADQPAAAKIKRALNDNPPNARARLVDFRVSETGMHVARC